MKIKDEFNECIENIKQQAEKVSKEKWLVGNQSVIVSNGKPLDFDVICTNVLDQNILRFIADAPENIRFLLSAIKRRDKEIEQLKMDKEELYQLATKGDFDENNWKEFERIFNK